MEITDTELLEQIKENNEEALEKIIERYKVVINGVLSKYKREASTIGLDVKDLYQEGLIGLITAIKRYDELKDASFRTFANLVIERQIIDLIKTNK